jgi:hypothetical protein
LELFRQGSFKNYSQNFSYINLILKRFKAPIIPPVNLYGMVIVDAVSIAIVTFISDISMCKLFAKKYNYDIHPNQVQIKNLI